MIFFLYKFFVIFVITEQQEKQEKQIAQGKMVTSGKKLSIKWSIWVHIKTN